MKQYTKAGSTKYKEAGARQRLSFERLREARLPDGKEFPPVAWKVAAAVWYLTATYSKAWDEVYVEKIAELAGCSRQNASTWLVKLEGAGVIEWRGSKWNGATSLVGLPKLPQEMDMSSNGDMSRGSHVSERVGNGLGTETLPKVTEEAGAKARGEPAGAPEDYRRSWGTCPHCGVKNAVDPGSGICRNCHLR